MWDKYPSGQSPKVQHLTNSLIQQKLKIYSIGSLTTSGKNAYWPLKIRGTKIFAAISKVTTQETRQILDIKIVN
jgi:hypothetical protein